MHGWGQVSTFNILIARCTSRCSPDTFFSRRYNRFIPTLTAAQSTPPTASSVGRSTAAP